MEGGKKNDWKAVRFTALFLLFQRGKKVK